MNAAQIPASRFFTYTRGMQIVKSFFPSICLFLAFSVLISACAPKMKMPEKPEEVSKYELEQRAEGAWQKERYSLAEQLYLQLVDRKPLEREEKLRFRRRLAYSAVQTDNFSLAERNLQIWKKLNPDAPDTWQWHKTVSKLKKRRDGDRPFREYLQDLLLQRDLSWSVKYRGLDLLTKHYLQEQKYSPLWRMQRKLYIQAEKRKQKLKMEKDFRSLVSSRSEDWNWNRIQDSIPQGRMLQYPYALLVWFSNIEQLQEEELDWSTGRKELGFILNSSELVDKDTLKSSLKQLEEEYGLPSLRIALLLPLNGPYQELGWNILKGLDVANWQYTRMQMDIQLQVINTAHSGWMEKLNQLPSKYSFVGGPLRKSVWKKIHQEEIHKERVFFTFLSDLNPGTEGETAYRFFPGLRDQVRPVVTFCKKQLGIDKFATLYPQSDYGVKRAKIFHQEVASNNATLTGLSGYYPGSSSGLGEVVADMLQLPENYGKEKNGTKNAGNATSEKRPDPDFKAVFLPDNFNKARLLIPEFFYYGEDRLVFLGPAMWSMEIKRLDKVEYGYFDLALMSGGWDKYRNNSAVEALNMGLRKTAQGRADFWVGLGYDFLRFVHALKLHTTTWPPEDLNKELSSISNFTWSMAPINWDEKGRAKQELFLLRPSSNGLFPVDKDRFRKKFNQAWESGDDQ